MTEQRHWRGGRRWVDPARAPVGPSTAGGKQAGGDAGGESGIRAARRWVDIAAVESAGAEVVAPVPGVSTVVLPAPEPPAVEPGEHVVPAPGTSDADAAESHDHALRGMFTRDFIYLISTALPVILAALVTPVLTRRVGAVGYGQLALAWIMMQILGPIFSFGLPFAAQKVFVGEDGDRRARGVVAVSVLLAILGSLVVLAAAPAWGPAVGLNRVLDARLAAVWAACFAVTWTCLAMLRSKDSLWLAILIGAVQSLGAQAAGVVLLYVRSPTVTSYLIGLIIGQSATALMGLVALRPDWTALRAIRRYGAPLIFGLPMVLQQLCVFILAVGDRIVIRHDVGSAATGRYSVAYGVGSLGVLLLVFVNQAWIPRIYAVADRAARSRLLASSRDMMNLLLVPVVVGLAAAAPVVLRIWAPPSFRPTALASIVAIVATATFAYGQFLSNVRGLMSEGRTDRAAVTTLIGATANIVLNLALVPLWGIIGSAIATTISYGLLALLTRLPASSGLHVPGVSRRVGIIMFFAVGVTLALAAVPTSHVWLAVRLAVLFASILGFLWLIRDAMSGFESAGRLVTPQPASAN